MKIAIVQTGSYGDNINSTLMFKPIKNKWSDSVIDVYTSTTYGSAFNNNRYINSIYQVPSTGKNDALNKLHIIPDMIANCGYDLILRPHPMINPDKWTSIKNGSLGTNLICAWVRALEDNDIEYTLPLETNIDLTNHEMERAMNRFDTININNRPVNLMEVQGESGQSFFNEYWAERTIHTLCGANQVVMVSCKDNTISKYQKIYGDILHFVGDLSIREVSYLYNKCDRFISVSSGLSNACNTIDRKIDVDWIEIINSEAVSSAPIRTINKIFWYDNNLDSFDSFLKARL